MQINFLIFFSKALAVAYHEVFNDSFLFLMWQALGALRMKLNFLLIKCGLLEEFFFCNLMGQALDAHQEKYIFGIFLVQNKYKILGAPHKF